MKTFLSFLLGGWLAANGLLAAEQESPLTKVGQMAPEFKLTTLDGKTIDSKQLRGKVVLVNFFATWCGPCMREMPRLETEIWQTFKTNNNFILVAVGREQSQTKLKKFQQKTHYTFAMAADPKREVYSKFATEGIPRTYLIDATGRIAFEVDGYYANEFKQLAQAVEKELAK